MESKRNPMLATWLEKDAHPHFLYILRPQKHAVSGSLITSVEEYRRFGGAFKEEFADI